MEPLQNVKLTMERSKVHHSNGEDVATMEETVDPFKDVDVAPTGSDFNDASELMRRELLEWVSIAHVLEEMEMAVPRCTLYVPQDRRIREVVDEVDDVWAAR